LRITIRRATLASVSALIHRVRTHTEHWNADAKPVAWTVTVQEILIKVRWT
jgi:hypothetical protein